MGSQRKEPIPVFAEMGSINPVFAFQNQLSVKAEQLAKEYAASLTLGVGQFCTNPGIFIAEAGDSFESFKVALRNEILNVIPVNMLHKGIFENFEKYKNWFALSLMFLLFQKLIQKLRNGKDALLL